EFVVQHMRGTKIDREPDRLQRIRSSETKRLQVGQTLIVDELLHASDTLVVDIHEAKDVGRSGAAGIEAALFGAEAQTGNTKCKEVGLLARRQRAAQPDEACLAVELAIGLSVVEVRQNGLQLLDRFVDVDDATRLSEERGGLDVGRQHLAIAI